MPPVAVDKKLWTDTDKQLGHLVIYIHTYIRVSELIPGGGPCKGHAGSRHHNADVCVGVQHSKMEGVVKVEPGLGSKGPGSNSKVSVRWGCPGGGHSWQASRRSWKESSQGHTDGVAGGIVH